MTHQMYTIVEINSVLSPKAQLRPKLFKIIRTPRDSQLIGTIWLNNLKIRVNKILLTLIKLRTWKYQNLLRH